MCIRLHRMPIRKGRQYRDAIKYALKQWQYLVRYIDDGRTPIDNNLVDRDIRPFTTG
jgi:transposase